MNLPNWRHTNGAPLPLWERSDRIKDAIRVRGLSPLGKLPVVSTDATPHPALRATFSHKGRRIRAREPNFILLWNAHFTSSHMNLGSTLVHNASVDFIS